MNVSVSGFDVTSAESKSVFECFKNEHGANFTIFKGWKSEGIFNPACVENLKTAESVGIYDNSIYLFPCPGKSAVTQVKDLISNLSNSNAKYNRIWMDVEPNHNAGCAWSNNYDSNCDYLQLLLSTALDNGVPAVGVFSANFDWEKIMNGVDGCKNASTYGPVWYYSGNDAQNFDDWDKARFGGWDKPFMKQTAEGTTQCGIDVDTDWK